MGLVVLPACVDGGDSGSGAECGNGELEDNETDPDDLDEDEFFEEEDLENEVCDDGNTVDLDGCSGDCMASTTSLWVVVMSGVNVPICARPSFGRGMECDQDGHYHGTVHGFNNAGTAYATAGDPAPADCGHGKAEDVHPTLKRITVDAGAISDYTMMSGESDPCWDEGA